MIALLQQPFWFLRHGETTANAADIIAGATDSPLTETGLVQARRAAECLAAEPIAAIWTSPLSRARHTAEVVARQLDVRLIVHPGLAERNWGAWEGQPRASLDRSATPPGGESPEAFRLRTRAALATIDGPFPVLIVAHSGIARELHAMICAKPFVRPDNAVPILWRPDAQGHWTFVEMSPRRHPASLGDRDTQSRSFR